MSIFNFLSKKDKSTSAAISMLPVMNQEDLSEDPANATLETATETKPLTVSYATGWPIDIIYGFLHKNYEEKGFNDAMMKNDLAFRDMNMAIIRNKILMIFREVNLNYDVMKKDIETRMDTCNAAGLLTTLSELNKQMSIIITHKSELEQLEKDFRNNANEASVPLQSYDCGFLRGIAAITMSTTQKVPQMSQPTVAPIFQQKVSA